MDQPWECVNWKTPLSDATGFYLQAICRNGGLVVVCDSSTLQDVGGRWRFTFIRAPAYRSVQETYRSDLWSARGELVGRTFTIKNSPFAAGLSANAPLFGMLCGKAQHYVFASDDEVFEVLSEVPPIIDRLPTVAHWWAKRAKWTAQRVLRRLSGQEPY